MSSLYILGCGGHGKVVAETAASTRLFSSISFLDDLQCGTVLDYPVVAKISSIFESNNFSKFDQFVVAIGNSKTRLDLTCRLLSFGYSVPVIVHPMATVSPSAFLGPGTVVFSQAVIQSSATTGKATILNTSCSVDHDTHLCDGVHICPGAHLAGHVTVGSCSWLGIGSSVIQNIHIGRNVVIGAGSTVLSDIPDDVTAVGTPARIL